MKTNKRDRAHPPVITLAVKQYLDETHRPRDAVLSELEKDAEKNEVPISGHLIGGTLSILARSSKAKNILEIGTATGYSGIWLARVAAANSGKLTTIELDPERQRIAERALRKAGIKENALKMILGDARKHTRNSKIKCR